MGLIIHHEKVDKQKAGQLIKLCPFGAISYDGKLNINAACKCCKLCVKTGPTGTITWEEDETSADRVDKSQWNGITVYCDRRENEIHPVTFELLAKARLLAKTINHPVYALVIGYKMNLIAEELLHHGADKVFIYDAPEFEYFLIGPYANAFTDFIQKMRPSSILVGATNLGRSLAPKVAARVGAGLTADCTALEMKENTDLVQIRPAFGGNIMAQIVSPNTRPQFCTVRYKIFSPDQRTEAAAGEIIKMATDEKMVSSRTEVKGTEAKPKEIDISDADIIIACGRGFRKEEDLRLAQELAHLLGAQLAGTRPLIEDGWLDVKRQIGLSGRTVKPKLIITLGVSGSVQFAAGMRNSDYIIAVNENANAGIFDVAHVGLVGDLYEIIPQLIGMIKKSREES